MLKLEGIEVRYGGSQALRGAGLEVNKGELVAVVGPNGAGKTTLFKAISGTVPACGHVTFEGADLLAMKPKDRAHLGIAHVPEGRKVFASMSVEENLEMGGSTEAGRADRRRAFEQIFSLFPILAERRAQLAGTLSGGQQQMLAIGRALASCPRLLMLDEPSMGLSPVMADTIFDAVREIRREGGMTILLVEQRVTDALADCDRGYVLEGGRVVLHGTPAELSPEKLRRAYLGV
jgi:branched-chain amino acid transport system ATP-binding protein